MVVVELLGGEEPVTLGVAAADTVEESANSTMAGEAATYRAMELLLEDVERIRH